MLDEFAVAGTACSSVVSVLRALHEDGFQLTCTPHPPAGHPPHTWELLSWDLKSNGSLSALLGFADVGHCLALS